MTEQGPPGAAASSGSVNLTTFCPLGRRKLTCEQFQGWEGPFKHAEERSGLLILALLPKCCALKICKVTL